jgi:spore germination protein GerM
MAAVKKDKKAPPKKKGPGSAAKGKAAPKKTVKKHESGRGALYMLIILFLLTVIVFLINISYDNLPFKSIQKDGGLFRTEEKGKVVIDKKDIEAIKKDPVSEDKKEKVTGESPAKEDSGINVKDKSADVKVYFLKLNENTEQLYLSPVTRKVADTNLLAMSLDSLIAGPSRSEKSSGYLNAVPGNLRVRSVVIKGKTAVIDFSGAIEEDAPGQILIKRLQQIIYTATEFDNVDNVIIKINGRHKNSIGADGLSISGPLSR